MSQRGWRYLTVGVICLAMILSVLCAGCSGDGSGGGSSALVVGKYFNQDDSSEYLELKSNGDYYLLERGVGIQGEWSVSGDTITIIHKGFPLQGTVDGNRITDNEGKVWVKRQ